MADDSRSKSAQVVHIVIACLAFCGNLLVCLLFLKHKVLLKKSYNVFLLLLAVTDLLAVVVLLVSSTLILKDVFPQRDSALANSVFCYGIWSGWILFTLSDASVYICLVLTYKRWRAVVKPHSYTTNFKKKHFVGITVAIYLVSLCSSLPRLFEVDYDDSRTDLLCRSWRIISRPQRYSMAFTHLTLNIIFPSGVMVGVYCDILYKTRMQKLRVLPSDQVFRTRQGRTRMVRIALFVMLTCWMPYQLVYLFSMLGVLELSSLTYHWSSALALFPSCINPFIYGVTNHTYQRGYFEIALGCCPVKVHGFLSRHLPMSRHHHTAMLVSSIHGRLRPLSAPQTSRQTINLKGVVLGKINQQ
ncbi:somatostatin receptor type 4-like [Montipora foliosa]|uniref:somatostatin receptor type 4-like n=1 Tax=Montipora foliosa TaxID=591990 RepID=UPI0035F2129F